MSMMMFETFFLKNPNDTANRRQIKIMSDKHYKSQGFFFLLIWMNSTFSVSNQGIIVLERERTVNSILNYFDKHWLQNQAAAE